MEGVEDVERKLADGVMRAGQCSHIVAVSAGPEGLHEFARVGGQEGRVIPRPDQQAVQVAPRQTVQVGRRADGGPILTQFILREDLAEALADVPGGQAGPDDIPELHRHMVEDAHADPGIVGSHDKGDAGTQAGPQNPQPLVTLPFQPIQAGPSIDHGLPGSMNRAPHIAGDVVVGPLESRRRALVMICQAHPQRGHSKPVQQPAEGGVAGRAGVPLRQHDHRPPAIARGWKERRVNTVVLRIR